MTVSLNDTTYSLVVKYECINSRILWINFKFGKVKAYIVAAYDNKGKLRFWSDLDRVLDKVGNEYVLCKMEDL